MLTWHSLKIALISYVLSWFSQSATSIATIIIILSLSFVVSFVFFFCFSYLTPSMNHTNINSYNITSQFTSLCHQSHCTAIWVWVQQTITQLFSKLPVQTITLSLSLSRSNLLLGRACSLAFLVVTHRFCRCDKITTTQCAHTNCCLSYESCLFLLYFAEFNCPTVVPNQQN